MRPAHEPARRRLRAEAAVRLSDPEAVLETLCAHFEEHGRVERSAGEAALHTSFGTGRLALREGRLLLSAEGAEDVGFSYVKLSLAEHVLRLAAPDRPRIVWLGDGEAGVLPPFFREMRVAAAQTLTPSMRRITLEGRDIARFAVGGLHVRLLIPAAGCAPRWPLMGEDGRPVWAEGPEAPERRVYTIRRIDPQAGRLQVDMVLHEGEGMPGARFAAEAKPGDVVGVMGPGGDGVPAGRRVLLAGDETALPAIGRILESLDDGVDIRVLVEIADRRERQEIASRARVSIEWLERGGRAPGTTTLLSDAVAAETADLDPETYVWAAGEFAAFKAMRRHLRGTLGRRKGDHLVAAYWRRGRCGDDA